VLSVIDYGNNGKMTKTLFGVAFDFDGVTTKPGTTKLGLGLGLG